MAKYPKGSEWRIWDLHIHTPGTAKNDQYGNDEAAWNAFINKIEANTNVAVLGVTDYFSIENYLYLKQKQAEGRLNGKTLLANVELRITPVTQQETPINIHVIFNPELSTDVIEREFFRCLKFRYKGYDYSCVKNDLIELGKAFKNDNSIDNEYARKEGIRQFNISFQELQQILQKQSLKPHIVVAVSNSNKDGNSGIQHSSMQATRIEIYRMSDIIFSGNPNDVNFFLGRGKLDVMSVIDTYGSVKPCITGSDAHSLSNVNIFPNERITWIKADPTFEGLKQIIYEPEGRVCIQKENPAFNIEKCPFTRIYIPTSTKVFVNEEDISFAPQELPLNSNLVSIIGGRGTGKSVLINYIAAAFHKQTQSDNFNLNSDIVISRQASISEKAKDFKVADNPNVPFMYIAQSQIKDLVQNKDRFSRNIRETIGVTDEYSISPEFLSRVETSINEYFRIIKIINANNTTPQEKREIIGNEIKKYSDFITNITSEQNKKKLESYKNRVGKFSQFNSWIDSLQQLVANIDRFTIETNENISTWNELFKSQKVDIPPIDTSNTKGYIRESLIPLLVAARQRIQKEIADTKDEFKDYKGDLATLLSNVSVYQNKVSELSKQIETIGIEEAKYQAITSDVFRNLGVEIKNNIESYAKLIEQKWNEFKGNDVSIDPKKKQLLDLILQENLNVSVDIHFDSCKMYNLLLEKLDGRSYNDEKIRRILNIETLDNFYDFISQTTDHNIFSRDIKDDLRGRLLELFFKRYTQFISHDVNVTLAGKSITKLSFGQQGTIYLRLQIAANMFSETIIYDQPEDDLDNSFITSELISIFKTIKQYRQIIIVSHNANLVVNSDSEQVIIAQNEDGQLKYMSGSLEDPDINNEVCQILEGGRFAFEKRERKYRIN
ncbi:TrlF family AAA-like ATPase [Bacteroides sp. AN502(2024)]|uniref:TrlF family AAA-like ATPase n=1 Tax=Bacteroides sp. AN502(2024) TaxID=3160599 RepID=UPI00351479AB